MAIVFADRVKVRSHSTGTGTFTLETTVFGFQSFEVIGNSNETYYGIEDAGGNWEVGIGTYTSSGTTLSRDSVISSSNNNALVNFPSGGKNVFTTIPSSVAANIIASTTYAFRDIVVAGQSTVIAESTTDSLTLVAGTGITIATDNTTDTITITGSAPDRLTNGFREVTLDATGSLVYPNVALQRDTATVTCAGNASTVVYTASGQYQHTIKLLIQVEGVEGVNTIFDTQACEMIVAKSFNGNDIAATVYGVVHTSISPLATFTAIWDSLISRVEIVCTTPSANTVNVRTFATEISTSD